MKDKGKLFTMRFTLDNEAWLLLKASKRRGGMSELVNLAVTEMRQGQEYKKTRKRKEVVTK